VQRGSAVGLTASARRLFGYLFRESPSLLALAVATAVGQAALLVPAALLVRRVFDVAIPREDTTEMVAVGVALVLLYGASTVLGYVSRGTALRLTTRVSTRLRLDVLAKLYALPRHWHDRQPAGEVLSLTVQDAERLEWMLADCASLIFPAILVGFGLVVTAAVVSPLLFAAVLVSVAPLALVVGRLTRRAHRYASRWALSSQSFSGQMHTRLRALGLTKAAGGEDWELSRADGRIRDLADSYQAFERARAANAAVDGSVAAVAGAVVLVVGGIAVAKHAASLGDLLSFYAVLALLLRQVHALAAQSNTVFVGMQALPRLEALLATEEDEAYASGSRGLRFRGEVVLDGVGFTYDDATPALSDVSLAIRPSEHVALIGPNGAGKSTLVSILLGFYRPQRGALHADGVPYDELEMRSFRRQIGVVLQDPMLLPGTIRENIAYARPDASDADVRAAAEAATAAPFIEALPDAYSTRIGDEGVGLSGGQRQRIAVARALLGAPALLILDEPTTYLDERAVTELMTRLARLPQSPALLLVTHDPNVTLHAERVIELRDGHAVGEPVTSPGRAA
jgi:ABC-type multidrug transport system fused ATPase/permease subunit